MLKWLSFSWVLLLAAGSFGATTQPASGPSLTFLSWSDQHVTRNGDASFLTAPVDAMNAIAGKPYPTEMGGSVDTPAFVLGVGDCVDWPTPTAVNAYQKATDRLHYQRYDLIGNHDEGAEDDLRWIVPLLLASGGAIAVYFVARVLRKKSRPLSRIAISLAIGLFIGLAGCAWMESRTNLMVKWITQLHGNTSYTFDQGGIHFIAIFSAFNPRQIITPAALDFIRGDLAKLPKGTPVIVATHYCYESIGNKDDFVNALGDANVILILGGHYHYASVNTYRGKNFVQVASPVAAPMFTVIRITPARIQAIPFNFKTGKWATTAVLDVPARR